ncbi:MAG: type II toxin-antitoxin system VapC family toxin [Armatimonadetes bacterium]|nr:type II toxin-antitoxin system VapC family toxin [Armatimonadota bacterium]
MAVTRVLLDTHVLLWALTEPEKLSPRARGLIEDLKTTVLVSSASAWEIATKHRLGRLPEAETVVHGYQNHLAALRATELAITGEHALRAGSMRDPHRDPFDRMLAAQALIEGVHLVTSDPAFSAFPVKTIW